MPWEPRAVLSREDEIRFRFQRDPYGYTQSAVQAARTGAGAQQAPAHGRAAASGASCRPSSSQGGRARHSRLYPPHRSRSPARHLEPATGTSSSPPGPREEAWPVFPESPQSHSPPECLQCNGPPLPGAGFSCSSVVASAGPGVVTAVPGQEVLQDASCLRTSPERRASAMQRRRGFILLPQIYRLCVET